MSGSPPSGSSIAAQRVTRGSPGLMGAEGEASPSSSGMRGSLSWRSTTLSASAYAVTTGAGATSVHQKSHCQASGDLSSAGSSSRPPRLTVTPVTGSPAAADSAARSTSRRTATAMSSDEPGSAASEVIQVTARCGCRLTNAAPRPGSARTRDSPPGSISNRTKASSSRADSSSAWSSRWWSSGAGVTRPTLADVMCQPSGALVPCVAVARAQKQR